MPDFSHGLTMSVVFLSYIYSYKFTQTRGFYLIYSDTKELLIAETEILILVHHIILAL